ncbi:M48 family metalloprotease [Armatimonas rosea]|uniref:Putative Zn-dependent protease n=1 Tax=Armatimonas rosea TaxID=685828 RepID=A0A7W9SVP1_ARMRO|nr:M48 family metalloprotease [Armatimonas rosea]MBB6053726.1 putative Zn-dependent protease [Armatimonas rosea]
MRRSPQLMIALVIAVVSTISYFGNRTNNEYTGKVQHLAMTTDQEIAVGLQSAPEMEAQYGGESRDRAAVAKVQEVGQRLLSRAIKQTPYKFQFHLLADRNTVNAFALPGGQVFITEALLRKLHTEGELAGVLGHEMGHVVARHGAQQLAKQQLSQGLVGAAGVAAYDPNNPSRSAATTQMAALVASTVKMKFGRGDELEADELGVRFLPAAGYDPRAMIGVMETLQSVGGGRQPEFFSTHPNPEHRIEKIKAAIEREFASGIPTGLEP